MKNVLVVYYSQSGQLAEIVQNLVKPMQASEGVTVDFYKIEMIEDFPFPWTNDTFFGAFPESFLMIPQEIKPIN